VCARSAFSCASMIHLHVNFLFLQFCFCFIFKAYAMRCCKHVTFSRFTSSHVFFWLFGLMPLIVSGWSKLPLTTVHVKLFLNMSYLIEDTLDQHNLKLSDIWYLGFVSIRKLQSNLFARLHFATSKQKDFSTRPVPLCGAESSMGYSWHVSLLCLFVWLYSKFSR